MYKRYEEYKDSGIEWIGEVPEHWKINKIKRTTYVKGRIGWQGLRADEFIDQGPYLVTGTDFVKGNIKWETCYHISQERFDEAPEIQLREDDVLITKDGSIGKVALVKNKPDKAILNSGVFVTRPRSKLYFQRFMFWILNSTIFYEFIKYMELGSTIKHLYQATFERMPFFLPGKDEQKSIAIFLDHKTSEIDSLIADKEKLIKKLEEYKQSIITEVVTIGLNPDVKMKDSGIEWIGEVPEHWKVALLKRCSTKITDGSHYSPRSSNNGYPYVTVQNINDGKIDFEGCKKIEETEYLSMEGNGCNPSYGDILLTKDGTIGRAAIVSENKKFVVLSSLAIITPNREVVFIDYLYYWLENNKNVDQMLSYIHGAALRRLTLKTINKLNAIVPPLHEQKAIASYLDQKASEIDSLIASNYEHITKLKQYRQSLIYEAVTGKIDVRDYQPERSEQLA